MKGQLKYLSQRGYKCAVLTSKGPNLNDFSKEENADILQIDMKREISPIADIISLAMIIRKLNKEKPLIVNAGTPKAGLLLMLGAFITRVPIRIYTLRGLRFETATGIKQKLLITTEKIAMRLSTKVISVSPSMRKKVLDSNMTLPNKIVVFGKGSSNGINIEHFKISEEIVRESKQIKKNHGIGEEEFILGYVGRINKDKGIEEVLKVFQSLAKERKKIKLLIVGDYDGESKKSLIYKNIIETDENIIHVGYQKDTRPFYYIMNVLMFLTKREGFGNVALEAASLKTPVIVQKVTGAMDTVIHNHTGFVIEKDDIEMAIQFTANLYNDKSMQEQFGENSREWVERNFTNSKIHRQIYELYENEIEKF